MKVYQEIATVFNSYTMSINNNHFQWATLHSATLREITKEHMPHGSGIDSGVVLDFDKSNNSRLVFTFGFHHMNDNGYYDGWTEHELIIKPSLSNGIDLKITGRDRNQIKDYLYETFQYALTRDI